MAVEYNVSCTTDENGIKTMNEFIIDDYDSIVFLNVDNRYGTLMNNIHILLGDEYIYIYKFSSSFMVQANNIYTKKKTYYSFDKEKREHLLMLAEANEPIIPFEDNEIDNYINFCKLIRRQEKVTKILDR